MVELEFLTNLLEIYLFSLEVFLSSISLDGASEKLLSIPSGQSVLALPVNFTVTALILALLVTFSCSLPLNIADVQFDEFRVDPS